jgi:hypothetical protein
LISPLNNPPPTFPKTSKPIHFLVPFLSEQSKLKNFKNQFVNILLFTSKKKIISKPTNQYITFFMIEPLISRTLLMKSHRNILKLYSQTIKTNSTANWHISLSILMTLTHRKQSNSIRKLSKGKSKLYNK